MKNYFFIFSLSLLASSIIYLFIKDDGLLEYYKHLDIYKNLNKEQNNLVEQFDSLKNEKLLLEKNLYYLDKKIRENNFIKSDEKTILIQ